MGHLGKYLLSLKWSEEVFPLGVLGSCPQTNGWRGMVRSGWENSARPEALALSLDYNVPADVLVRETDWEKRRVLFTNSSGRTVRLIVVCSGYSRYTSLFIHPVHTEGNVYHQPVAGESSLITHWDNVFLNNPLGGTSALETWCLQSFIHAEFSSDINHMECCWVVCVPDILLLLRMES